jgi:hypothetical protein
VDGLLALLHPLVAVDLVEENPADLARYGLGTPAAALVVGLTGDAGIAKTLLLGGAAGASHRYAMMQGQDVVFLVDEEIRDRLTAPLYENPAGVQDGVRDSGTGATGPGS